MNSDQNWKNVGQLFSQIKLEERSEEENSDNETKYYDSLCPQGDNQEYVDKLKDDIRNLRKEYSKTSRDENLTTRSFWEDLAKTKTSLAKRSSSTNSRDPDLEINTRHRSSKGDAWFSSSRFQDSGERLCGGRRYSETWADRGRKSKDNGKAKATRSK